MWECIAKKLGLPWHQVETRFFHFFREKPGLLLEASKKGDQVNLMSELPKFSDTPTRLKSAARKRSIQSLECDRIAKRGRLMQENEGRGLSDNDL